MNANQAITQAEFQALAQPVEEAKREIQKCLMTQQRSRKQPVFGLITALKLLMLPVPRNHSLNNNVHVCSPTKTKRSCVKGTTYHTFVAASSIKEIRIDDETTVLITDEITTCVQMASFCSKEELVVILDAISQRHRSRGTECIQELRRRVSELRSSRGIRNLRWALQHTVPKTDSPMETRVRLLLERSGFPRPAVNEIFVDPVTGENWHVDMSYPKLGIVIEYQGRAWHTGKRHIQLDSNRILKIQGHGCEVLTIDKEHICTEHSRRELVGIIRRVVERKRKRNADFLSFFPQYR